MKEKMRALLVKNPEITLPEAARALNANERNCKSVRVAYWKARALLWEELSDESLRELLIRKGAYEGPLIMRALLNRMMSEIPMRALIQKSIGGTFRRSKWHMYI